MTDSVSSSDTIGVIGAGAMGMGIVRSLRRAGMATCVRDISAEAESTASSLGARIVRSPARACARVPHRDRRGRRRCAGRRRAVRRRRRRRGALPSAPSSCSASTLDPDYVSALAPRLARHGVALIDAPMSGGPQRAAEGTMTMMVAGPADALDRARTGVRAHRRTRVSRRRHRRRRGALQDRQQPARRGRTSPRAPKRSRWPSRPGSIPGRWSTSSTRAPAQAGSSRTACRARWPATSQPRAAAKILTKDVGIAADFAARLGVEAPFARAALQARSTARRAGLRRARRRRDHAARARALMRHSRSVSPWVSMSMYCHHCDRIGCGT